MTGWKKPLDWVTHNFLSKLLALAGAVLIWILVASEPELSTFTTVRLEYRNLPNDLEISSAPMETVTLELRGPSGELRGAGEGRRAAVVLDTSHVRPGQQTFEIGYANISLPRGVTLVRAIPSEVRMEFEPRATSTVPVKVRFRGENPNGHKVARYTVSPEKLTIVGPAGHVTGASAITDPIDVSSAAGTEQFRVNAFVTDSFDRFVNSPQVVVTVVMREPTAEGERKQRK